VSRLNTGAKIGIFGGTFDPVHMGHVICGEAVWRELGLDSILFVPNRQPPHKPDRAITPASDRVAMLRLALTGRSFAEISLIEVDRPGPSYAVDTVGQLRREHGQETNLVFILGRDALLGLADWHEPDRLIANCSLAVMSRRGEFNGGSMDGLMERFPLLRSKVIPVDVPVIDISSSEVRRRVASGQTITGLVPDAVEEYILNHGLYRKDAV
jgi:nicotinate-nucleotide adenylyltransferase